MRATPGACIKSGCLVRRPLCHEINLAASCEPRRPLCHKVNLLSCLARRPQCHRVNLPSCVVRRRLFHKVNLPRCEARRRRFIMTCDIFGTGQTNILAVCYLFGKKRDQPTVAPLKPLKSIHSTKLLEKLLTWAAHTFHWRLWWFPWNVWNWEV